MSKTEATKRATRASAKTTRFGSFVRLDPRAASTRTLPPVSSFPPRLGKRGSDSRGNRESSCARIRDSARSPAQLTSRRFGLNDG